MFGLQIIGCCEELKVEEERFPYAEMHVCDCNLHRFPQIAAFVRSEMKNQWGSKLKVRQVRGVLPTILLKSEDGQTHKTLSVEKWDTDTVTEFLNGALSSGQKVALSIDERDIVKLVLEFLENRRIHITQVALERETGVINGDYSDDILFLRQLILWDSALQFIEPLKEFEGFPSDKFQFLLVVKGLLYEYALVFCQQQAMGGKNTLIQSDCHIPDLLSRKEKISSADLSLISWLEMLGNEQFTIPFQQKEFFFRINSHAKPNLEAQWSEQILSTPIKPGGQFPYSMVPHSKPKFAQKLMAQSMTASLIFDPGRRRPIRTFCNQPMSQSTLPSASSFSIQQPLDNGHELDSDVMRQSQIISDMLSESSSNTLPSNLKAICQRNQLKLPLHQNQRDKIGSESGVNSLAPVPELDTPAADTVEGTLPFCMSQIARHDISMEQSRLFQQFQAVKSLEQQQIQATSGYYQQQAVQQQNANCHPVFVSPHFLAQNDPRNAYFQTPLPIAMRHNNAFPADNLCLPPMAKLCQTKPVVSDQYSPEYPNVSVGSENDVRKQSIEDDDLLLECGENDLSVGRSADKEQMEALKFVPVCCYEDAQAIRAVAFHPSGGYFAIGTNSRNLLICRYQSSDFRASLNEDYLLGVALPPNVMLNRNKHHRGSVYCASFNQTGEIGLDNV
uniref:LisH domain-containing protein n=1 Tax=Globodera pallida TaxID=36090 RepID=A0A183CGY5_GLOPA